MTVRIKPQRNAYILIVCATIGLLPTTGLAKSKSITPTDLLETLLPGEPWDRGVFSSTKTVNFQQATTTSGGVNATTVAKMKLSYFTSANCSGSVAGSGSYTTPNGTSYTISVGTPFGLVAASTWNVGSTKLSIADMTTIRSVAITLKSTNSNTPQANFTGVSFACVPVTCTAGPAGQCTSASGTQSFQLKTTADIGDPADGGVIACTGDALNNLNLVVPSSDNSAGIAWSPALTTTSATSTTDGATNTATIVTSIGAGTTYAAGLCSAYATTGGYTTGWFLPAKAQLDCLYGNQAAIGGFAGARYWSSTEVNAVNAWFQDFSDGSQNIVNKLISFAVRCSRGFTP
jgi:hypothetical protein